MSTARSESATAAVGRSSSVNVLFYLHTADDWPPYPGEVVTARVLNTFLVEVTGTPRYAYGINRGDHVVVTHDGFGYIGRHVKTFSGHSTVRVVATTLSELAPILTALTAAGAGVEIATDTTMLVVDVPATVDLSTVENILDSAISMTCNYEIASDRHRQNGLNR